MATTISTVGSERWAHLPTAVREELDLATGNGIWEAQILARFQRRLGVVSIFIKKSEKKANSKF